MHHYQKSILLSLPLLALTVACAAPAKNIPGTKIVNSSENREIVETVEKYRLALEKRDSAMLLSMASKGYWEDGGTTTGKDDYGYDKLSKVLSERLSSAEDIRYSLRYVKVKKRCLTEDRCRAYVDVLVDASYSVQDANERLVRRDKRDQNQFVLEWDDGDAAWKFLSGM